MFLLSGTGDLIEPDDGIIGIGSGGAFAQAAAQGAGAAHRARRRARSPQHAMTIAAEICIYTNANLTIEEL